MSKCNYVCAECGSANVKRDAWVSWDTETQSWEVTTAFDAAWCDDCDGATTLSAVELARED